MIAYSKSSIESDHTDWKPIDAVYTKFRSHSGAFRPSDERAGPSQFLGSFSADVFLSNDRKNLIFVVSDSKSFHSLLEHLTHYFDRERSPLERRRFSNTYQKYIWYEKINSNLF